MAREPQRLVRRAPTTDLASMLERFWSEPTLAMPRTVWGAGEAPEIRVDVVQEPSKIKVTATVPGLKREDLHVEIQQDELRIWGERKEETTHEDASVVLQENHYGRIERRLMLPHEVDAERSTAVFRDGVLHLTLPHAETDGHRELEIGE